MENNVSAGPQDNQQPVDSGSILGTPESKAPAWTAQLDKELQSDAGLTKFKTISELGKSYKELEGRLGKAIVPPGDNASSEEWQAYYRKMGAPGKPDDYKLDASKVPKNLYSPEMETQFRTWAHEQGLTQKQAQVLYDKFNESAVKSAQSRAAESQRAMSVANESLKTEWGQSYDENMGHVKRAMTRFGSPEIAKVFAQTGAGNDPGIVKMFAAIGREIGEATLLSGAPASSTPANPADLLYPSMRRE